MPRIRQVAPDMAKTARAEGWDPLELLVKALHAGRGPVGKMAVVGARDRASRKVSARVVPSTDGERSGAS